jgi:hypothetical protein
MDKGLLIAVIFLLGIITGYLLFDWHNKGAIVTKTVTERTTDTVYVAVKEIQTVIKKEIKTEYLRDTILLEPYESKIIGFKTSKSFLYGNTTVSGEVLGEVLKMDIVNDFKIPTITNTITNTTTIIKKPSGIFLTAGVNTQLVPSVGAIFIKDKYLIGLTNNSIQLGYKLGRQ